jgi:hypothetical protein
MQALELSLYTTLKTTHKFNPKPQEIGQINPLIHESSHQDSIQNVLNSIFPQQSEENKITRTRRILGETAKTISDEQIECITTEFQFLIDTWLDEYEKKIFNGMTLKEVLNEK